MKKQKQEHGKGIVNFIFTCIQILWLLCKIPIAICAYSVFFVFYIGFLFIGVQISAGMINSLLGFGDRKG